jgi:glutaredoxin
MHSCDSSADAERKILAPAILDVGRRLLLAVAVCLFLLPACKAGKDQPSEDEATASEGSTLPFTVDAKVLYTWIKEDGSFQLSEKLEEIPAPARQLVRVVVEGAPPGSPTHVFVANLSAAKAGDQLKATPLGRTEWEANGLEFRKAKVEPLEKQAAADAPSPPMAQGKNAVVYGADWCGPCHQAEDYLKKLGVAVVKKDIEEDPNAATEMRAKLRTAGLGSSSSIPILDVAGTMLIGFSPRAIDAALRAGQK